MIRQRISGSLMDFIKFKKKKENTVRSIRSLYMDVDWDGVDLIKVRRRIEDRLRKDDEAVKMTALFLETKLGIER